ncbi:hypothetical protein J6590_025370 [Homalodisca vitripennis]|nr:hypothetical protein J6590_025370 [Homalodisca vitripennis]
MTNRFVTPQCGRITDKRLGASYIVVLLNTVRTGAATPDVTSFHQARLHNVRTTSPEHRHLRHVFKLCLARLGSVLERDTCCRAADLGCHSPITVSSQFSS